MFELIKNYICNSCGATATESKAKKWTHLSNSPNDGSKNLDFCPTCTEMLRNVLQTKPELATHSVKAEHPVQPTVAVLELEPKQHEKRPETLFSLGAWESVEGHEVIAVLDNAETTDTSVDSTESNDADTAEQPVDPLTDENTDSYVDFYNQLYSRIIYDVACDCTADAIATYAPFIPGKISVDNDSTDFGKKITLKFNSKRLVITYESDKLTSEIQVCQGRRVLYTRKVSRFAAVQSFVKDIANTDMNFLPDNKSMYTAKYIRNKLTEIDAGILNGVDLHDLKSWIKFIIDQLKLEL